MTTTKSINELKGLNVRKATINDYSDIMSLIVNDLNARMFDIIKLVFTNNLIITTMIFCSVLAVAILKIYRFLEGYKDDTIMGIYYLCIGIAVGVGIFGYACSKGIFLYHHRYYNIKLMNRIIKEDKNWKNDKMIKEYFDNNSIYLALKNDTIMGLINVRKYNDEDEKKYQFFKGILPNFRSSKTVNMKINQNLVSVAKNRSCILSLFHINKQILSRMDNTKLDAYTVFIYHKLLEYLDDLFENTPINFLISEVYDFETLHQQILRKNKYQFGGEKVGGKELQWDVYGTFPCLTYFFLKIINQDQLNLITGNNNNDDD